MDSRHLKPFGTRERSFQILVLSAIVGLLALTVVPIISYNYYKNKDIVLSLNQELMHQVVELVIEKTSNYFLPASISTEMSSRLAQLGAIECTNPDRIESYTLGVLKSYPQISQFYLADEQGSYIRAWRLPDGIMETRIILPNASPPTDLFHYWKNDFEIFETRVSNTIEYDPRVRPWYIGARDARTNFWTDVYILFRNKKPAVTSAFPVLDEKGNVIRVWAMDIELDAISDFLRELKIGKSGVVFIINQKHEVVAHPDISRIIKEEAGKLRPVRIEELESSPINTAFREHIATGNNNLFVESEGKRYFASVSRFPETFPVPWEIVLVVPEDDFTSDAWQLIKQSLFLCMLILGMAVLMAVFIARSISRPIQKLTEETGKIKNFQLDGRVAVRSHIKEIQSMSNAISAMKSGLKAFRRYVPHELVRQLVNTGEEARLGGHKKELTILFSDIAGFTAISESMTPEELMLHLSEYFDELTKILTAQKATIDKFIGDAILAFWGAPVPDEDHVLHACRAGLRCQKKIRELNRKWESQGKQPFITRIGISTGVTLVGNVGSSERINYTVMGDNVNLASRLEGANKLYGSGIIVTQRTHDAVSDGFLFRLLGIIAVKGKSEETTIYELVAEKEPGDENAKEAVLCRDFTNGVKAYLAGEWDKACDIFERLSAEFPPDPPTAFYLARCRQYRGTKPAADWRGIEYVES